MTRFVILLALLVVSFTSIAAQDSYYCELKKGGIRPLQQLSRLGLPGYHQGKLEVAGKYCTGKTTRSHSDFCRMKGNSLIIGKKLRNSLFITKKGEIFEFSCEALDDLPGHGGSDPAIGGHTCARCK